MPFFKEEGWASSYLLSGDEHIVRVSVIGTLIQKSEDNLSGAIDDGSGSISVRVFEDKGMMAKGGVGDVLLVVGKPREYGNERYLLPEIVQKVDSGWLKVWAKEIAKRGDVIPAAPKTIPSSQSPPQSSDDEETLEEPLIEEVEEIGESSAEKICAFIRSNDSGGGVDVQQIIEAKVAENTESLISQLLKNGDIFEIRPGRVKVLE